MKKNFLSFGILILLIVSSAAQQRTIRILDLQIEGNKTADAGAIRLNSGLSAGRDITGEDIQNAIRQLWTLDIFSDVNIVADKQIADGVYLIIRVKEYPRLEKLELDGNKKIKKDDIESKLNFYTGQVITPSQITKGVSRLKKLYQEKGYLLAEFSPETIVGKDEGKMILKMKIREGAKVKVKQISFTGNRAYTGKKLKKQFSETKEKRWWRLGGGDFKHDKYQEDLDKLVKFYRNNGFRDAEVVRDSIYYGPKKKDMFIDITVHEGVKYKFGNITFSGNTLFNDKELVATLGFVKGEDYNLEKYEKGVRENLQGLYYDRGYIYTQIQPQEIPVSHDTLDIQFNIVEGNPVKIGRINIYGNTKTKEKVIRRELKIKPGDTFSKEALVRSVREVTILNYFANVLPDVKPVDEEKVDLEIKVEEKSTDTANMSAGYSQRDGLIGSVGITMNNFNGNGQKMNFDWQFGRIFRQFSIGFTDPWIFDTRTLLGLSFYDTKRGQGYYSFDERRQGGSVRLGRRLNWPDNYFRVDGIFRIEKVAISNIISNDPELASRLLRDFGKNTQISLTGIISRDSRNHPEFPSEGSVYSLSSELTGGPLGGTYNYHKHIFSAEWYIPVFWKFVLYSNSEFGVLDALTKTSRIPPTELFFMGGSGLAIGIPLRGYDERSIGPRTAVGSVLGGRAMTKFSTELRFPIVPNPTIFGLFFAEGGNVWDSFESMDPYRLNRSVGMGIRLFMPLVGIIGLDFGYGFDNIDPTTGARHGEWKPHFQFGRGF